MTEAAVEFANVSFTPASGASVIEGITLQLAPGTCTALLGRSGSGKTTLMRMVNGLVTPTGGSVAVGGKPVSEWNLLELRRGIGYVIQETGLFPHWTVERNVGLALELLGNKNGKPRIAEMLKLAGLDPELGSRFPWQLSGGQRQRVGLARALAGDPGVLLMDEPFGALDPITRAEIQTTLKELLSRLRKTVLLVTHDLDEALYLAGRVIFLEAGNVVADLSSEDVLESRIAYVTRYVAAVRRGDRA